MLPGSALGGVAVAWELIYKLLPPGVDPFAPENPIIISVGSLVGTAAPGASKIAGTAKFPAIADEKKHFVGSSVSGGRDFGLMMRNAGCEHIVISGKSESPVYLVVDNGEVEICDAAALWGKSTEETTGLLKQKYGSECGCAAIGPAGENLVRYAFAVVDMTNSLGRSGLGALFGSKNLKAIVVKGERGISVKDPQRYEKYVRLAEAKAQGWDNLDNWLKLGMGAGWPIFRYTQYPGKWTRERWDSLYGEKKRLETLDKIIGCSSCRISCRVKWRIGTGKYAGEVGMGSPYGKSATSGQLLDVEDHRKMLHLVSLANRAGIDFYSFTRLVDWVTASSEQGKIADDRFSDELQRSYDHYLQLLSKTVNREGVGDILAEGWNPIGEELGLDPQDYWYAGICKGVDFIYDARAAKLHPLMMTFFTNPRPHHGGNHTITTGLGKDVDEIREQLDTWGLPPEAMERIFAPTAHSGRLNVGRYTKWMEDAMAVRNSLGVCSMYSAFGLENMDWVANIFSAVTGIEMSSGDLMRAGERAFNFKKLANVREGFRRKDDRPPRLWLRPMHSPEGELRTEDYYKEKVITEADFEKILDDYYDERGWDRETGVPPDKKLEALGIER
jgi:aldehyde:ferredoxin oxidoreductase